MYGSYEVNNDNLACNCIQMQIFVIVEPKVFQQNFYFFKHVTKKYFFLFDNKIVPFF
jgi:hypothetical protein